MRTLPVEVSAPPSRVAQSATSAGLAMLRSSVGSLSEAIAICSAIGAGIGIAYAISQGWSPVVPPIALGGGLLAAVVIGAVAGLYPSLRAARVSPTDALRGG